LISSKPFKVTVDGQPAIALRYDKEKPRAMKIRERKKGLKRDIRC